MTALINIPEAAPALYEAAMGGVVRYDASVNGRLRLTERDRADLLHRLSTNDLKSLTPGMGTRTVVVNHNARIIDLLTVYSLPEHLLVITSPEQNEQMVQLLRKNIFFQDKVQVEDTTTDTVQWNFYGLEAAAFLAKVTSVEPDEWAMHHIQAVQINGGAAWLARTLPLAGDGFTLVATSDDWTMIAPIFEQIPQLDAATYEVLRVEAGYPAWGHELSLEYIPLETQLRDAVSFSKGCYVGQEIIARMDSRQRLAKQLMRLHLGAAATPSDKLMADGKEQGDLTSVVKSPQGGIIGLGYVRTAYAQPGTRLTTVDGVSVEVQELPTTG